MKNKQIIIGLLLFTTAFVLIWLENYRDMEGLVLPTIFLSALGGAFIGGGLRNSRQNLRRRR